MLSQLQRLSQDTDGRYATDAELQFVLDYLKTYGVRLQTYQRLRDVEGEIVQQVYVKMRASDPNLFFSGEADVSIKWKRDTIRVLRYSAIAMLLNDPETLSDRLLLWMQSIMRAFGAQRSCRVTYEVMQDVVRKFLTPDQASVFCPILEINRRLLGVE